MPQEAIPEDLRRFILTSVPSVPFVEALLVFRESPAECLTIDVLCQRLYVSETVAAGIVEELHAGRLIERVANQAGYRFAPAPEMQAIVEMLASCYRTHLVDVTHLIHSKTRRMAEQFANAFKLRKD